MKQAADGRICFGDRPGGDHTPVRDDWSGCGYHLDPDPFLSDSCRS
jgi:hypothetical protein